MTKAIIWSQNYSNCFLGHGNIVDMRLSRFPCDCFVIKREKFIHNCILLTVFKMKFPLFIIENVGNNTAFR